MCVLVCMLRECTVLLFLFCVELLRCFCNVCSCCCMSVYYYFRYCFSPSFCCCCSCICFAFAFAISFQSCIYLRSDSSPVHADRACKRCLSVMECCPRREHETHHCAAAADPRVSFAPAQQCSTLTHAVNSP